MTNKERVYAALSHEQPDRTPYQIGFTQKALAAMVDRYGSSDFLGLIDNCIHGVAARPGPKERWLDENTWQDEFGVQWDRSIDRDIGNVCNRVLAERNLNALELPDPHAPGRFEGFTEQVAAGEGRFVQFGIGFSLFERAWTLRGMENLLMDMIEA
ncbi:MAG: uroporphyrinogen-III decarboxylase-like protein, partial [Armatimonadota bacterium]